MAKRSDTGLSVQWWVFWTFEFLEDSFWLALLGHCVESYDMQLLIFGRFHKLISFFQPCSFCMFALPEKDFNKSIQNMVKLPIKIREWIRCSWNVTVRVTNHLRGKKLNPSKTHRFRTSEMNLNTIGVSEILFRNSKSLMFHISLWLNYRHYVIVSSCFTKHQLTSLPDSKARRQWICEWKMLQCGERSTFVQHFGHGFFLDGCSGKVKKNMRPMTSECPQPCLLMSHVFTLHPVKFGA